MTPDELDAKRAAALDLLKGRGDGYWRIKANLHFKSRRYIKRYVMHLAYFTPLRVLDLSRTCDESGVRGQSTDPSK